MKILELGAATVVAGVVVFIAMPPGPSASAIQAAKTFCQSVPSQYTIPELLAKASNATNPSVKAEAVAPHKVLLRIGLCHCMSTFSEVGVTTSPVMCNG